MSEETDQFLEHYGVKGMKWGVRKSDGTEANLSRNARRQMEKSETKFQSKRASANAKARADRKAGVVNPKNAAKATKYNEQHKKNTAALRKQGLEVYKKMPESVKSTKVSAVKSSAKLTRGQKVATHLLVGPVAGTVLIRRAEGRDVLTGRPKN